MIVKYDETNTVSFSKEPPLWIKQIPVFRHLWFHPLTQLHLNSSKSWRPNTANPIPYKFGLGTFLILCTILGIFIALIIIAAMSMQTFLDSPLPILYVPQMEFWIQISGMNIYFMVFMSLFMGIFVNITMTRKLSHILNTTNPDPILIVPYSDREIYFTETFMPLVMFGLFPIIFITVGFVTTIVVLIASNFKSIELLGGFLHTLDIYGGGFNYFLLANLSMISVLMIMLFMYMAYSAWSVELSPLRAALVAVIDITLYSCITWFFANELTRAWYPGFADPFFHGLKIGYGPAAVLFAGLVLVFFSLGVALTGWQGVRVFSKARQRA